MISILRSAIKCCLTLWHQLRQGYMLMSGCFVSPDNCSAGAGRAGKEAEAGLQGGPTDCCYVPGELRNTQRHSNGTQILCAMNPLSKAWSCNSSGNGIQLTEDFLIFCYGISLKRVKTVTSASESARPSTFAFQCVQGVASRFPTA